MGNSLSEIAPTREINLRVIGLGGESYDSYTLNILNDRSFKLTSKTPGRLNFYISTARGTLNLNDLSNPIDIILSADGETCDGQLSYENGILVVKIKEYPKVVRVAIFDLVSEANIREMEIVRQDAKEIVLKSVMPYVTLKICPHNRLKNLVYKKSDGSIWVDVTEEYSRESPRIYTASFFEELDAIVLIINQEPVK